MRYDLSVQAKTDLADIWKHTFENWSVKQADTYIGILFHAMDQLCDQPEMGRNFEHVRTGYRGFRIKSHIIFYRMNNGKTLEVMRILHKKIDVDARLNG